MYMCVQTKVSLLSRWMERGLSASETCSFVPRRAGATNHDWQQEMVDLAETCHEAKVLGLIFVWGGGGGGGGVKVSSTIHAHQCSPPDILVPTPPLASSPTGLPVPGQVAAQGGPGGHAPLPRVAGATQGDLRTAVLHLPLHLPARRPAALPGEEQEQLLQSKPPPSSRPRFQALRGVAPVTSGDPRWAGRRWRLPAASCQT